MTRIDQVIELLRAAASAPPAYPQTFAAWRERLRIEGDPFMAAVTLGANAEQLAFAFAGGYQAALRRALPSLSPNAFAALLVSEGRHQHPADLQTRLHVVMNGAGNVSAKGTLQLDGEKSFVTGGELADVLLVLARDETLHDDAGNSGPARGAIIHLPQNARGVTHLPRKDGGILPALPHGRVRFDAVTIAPENILQGDGWKDWARPFRTIEDIHVSAAIASHVAVAAWRYQLPQGLLAAVIAALARLADAATFSPDDPRGHLLLAGFDEEMLRIATRFSECVDARDDDFCRDWRANRMIMALAVPARVKRLEKAMAWLHGAAPG